MTTRSTNLCIILTALSEHLGPLILSLPPLKRSIDRSASSCDIKSSAVFFCRLRLSRFLLLLEISARIVPDLDRIDSIAQRMAISNADGDSVARERKLNKIEEEEDWRPSLRKWRTEREQKIYSSKLVKALRRVRSSTKPTQGLRRSRVIRKAADRALAVAARGRTQWSRAILSNRKLNLKRRRPAPSFLQPAFSPAGDGCQSATKKNRSPILEGKAAVLGQLVPGGRKLSFPMLLEEASDYIAALQMQVRAMSALTTILSASGGTRMTEADHSAP